MDVLIYLTTVIWCQFIIQQFTCRNKGITSCSNELYVQMQTLEASECSLYRFYSVRPTGPGGKAVAYLDLQIHLENKALLGHCCYILCGTFCMYYEDLFNQEVQKLSYAKPGLVVWLWNAWASLCMFQHLKKTASVSCGFPLLFLSSPCFAFFFSSHLSTVYPVFLPVLQGNG